jgi:hypothetical protein
LNERSADAMKFHKNKSEIIETTKFFLITLFFSPAANPAFVILGTAGIFLMVVGDIKPQDVLFLMFALSLCTLKVADYFKKSNNEISTFLNIIPLSLQSMLTRIIIASFVFSLLSQLLIFLLLNVSLSPPKLGDAQFTFQKTGGEILSVIVGYKTDLSGRYEIPTTVILRPSLIFGTVKSLSGYEAKPVILLLFFIYLLATVYFVMSSIIDSCIGPDRHQRRLNKLIQVLFIFLGIINFFDLILPSGIIWNMRAHFLDNHQWITYAFETGMICLFILALIQLISRIDNLKVSTNSRLV